MEGLPLIQGQLFEDRENKRAVLQFLDLELPVSVNIFFPHQNRTTRRLDQLNDISARELPRCPRRDGAQLSLLLDTIRNLCPLRRVLVAAIACNAHPFSFVGIPRREDSSARESSSICHEFSSRARVQDFPHLRRRYACRSFVQQLFRLSR